MTVRLFHYSTVVLLAQRFISIHWLIDENDEQMNSSFSKHLITVLLVILRAGGFKKVLPISRCLSNLSNNYRKLPSRKTSNNDIFFNCLFADTERTRGMCRFLLNGEEVQMEVLVESTLEVFIPPLIPSREPPSHSRLIWLHPRLFMQ